MLAAIYARHSTDRQCTSTHDQIERCRRYCADKGYAVVNVFTDEAISGSHMINRPGIRALMTAAVEAYFNLVITEDLSRISRDQGDTANFFKKMAFLDVAVETVSEGPISELHIGLKSTMNALYLKDLADKTHRGMIASVLKGAVPGGRTYGYDIVHQLDEKGEPIRGLRAINQEEAEVVRGVFKDYAAGKTLKRICADLNALAIPAPKGGKWIHTTLVGTAARQTGMLRQTLYKGVVTFNRMAYRKHPETGRRLSVVRPESEWLSVPIPELAIVDEELFGQVQLMIEERSSMRKQRILTNRVLSEKEKAEREAQRQRQWRARQTKDYSNAAFMFGGLLHCARHGEPLKSVRARVWSCPAKGCPNRNLHFDQVMPLVLDAAARIDEGQVLAYFESAAVVAAKAEHEAAIEAMSPQVEALREEIRNLLQALGRRDRTSEIRGFLDDKEKGLRRLRLDIEKRQKAIAALSEPPRLNGTIKTYRRFLAVLSDDPLERRLHAMLRPVFKRFDLVAEWDGEEETWRRSARATFNYHKLMALNS